MNTIKRIIPEPHLTYSRKLRTGQTVWEVKLWRYLRAGRFYGLKFKRQVQIGKFIFDFSCRDRMVLIELDGGQHSENVVLKKDQAKQEYGRGQGYIVLRFWNNDLDNNIEGVLAEIKKACKV
jgi:very-short-patch-repair endonuclease